MMMDAVLERPERLATAIGGAALVVWGANKLSRERHPLGAVMATTGAGLIWRSARGDTRARLAGSRGVNVDESFSINRAPQELYEFWRNLELLPRVMPELSSVRVIDTRRSHWVAKGPAGFAIEWHADIINDIPNELIAWCRREYYPTSRSAARLLHTKYPGARGCRHTRSGWGGRFPEHLHSVAISIATSMSGSRRSNSARVSNTTRFSAIRQ